MTSVSDSDAGWSSRPDGALRVLLAGNERFVRGDVRHPNQDAQRRQELAPGQRPFAVLFGCADSRLAAEIIFDRGLGDLFVVRTAGHVVGPEVLGSIEYAVAVLDVPLVVVLGHDSCGAIAATLDALERGVTPAGFMRDVVERVMLSVLAARALPSSSPRLSGPVGAAGEAGQVGDSEVREHVRYTAGLLVARSSVIGERVADGRCAVVGMSYQLAQGNVCPVVSFPTAVLSAA